MRKLTKEILQERSDVLHNCEYEMIDIKQDNLRRILIKHKKCGNEYRQKIGNHIQKNQKCSICYGTEKITKDVLQKKSNDKYNNEYLIIGDPLGYLKNVEIKHLTCGTIFETTPDAHIKNKGGNCFHCFTITTKKMQEMSDEIHNFEYEILGEYKGYIKKVKIRHKICGNIFLQDYDNHIGKKHGCPECNGTHILSKEILQERSDKKYNGEYEILGNYINNHTHILIKHKICDHEFNQLPNNHLRRKCPKCYGTPKKTNDEFQKESNLVHNNEYELVGDYKDTHSLITLKHKLCGKEFDIIAIIHLNGGKCKYCLKSKREKELERILIKYNIKYICNHTFDDCKNIFKLRFDFYLPDLNICIEIDGDQHFMPIEFFGGESAFQSTKKRDEIKNEFCKKNAIILIRISYLENIFEKLNENLHLINND